VCVCVRERERERERERGRERERERERAYVLNMCAHAFECRAHESGCRNEGLLQSILHTALDAEECLCECSSVL